MRQKAELTRPSKSQHESGATLAEFAIVLPLFLFLVFSIFDFSRIISRRTILSNAMRIAARNVAAIPPPSSIAQCQSIGDARLRLELQRVGLESLIQNVTVTRDSSLEAIFGGPVIKVQLDAAVDCFLCPLFNNGLITVDPGSRVFEFDSFAVVPLESGDSCT